MPSLKWVPAATPSPPATARADGALTFRPRIRACSQPEIRACRARRPGRRGAAERGSGKARAGNLPRLRTPRAGVALVAPLRTRIPPLCPALVQLTHDRLNPVRRRQPRRRCLQRGAGCAGTPARTPLDAGSRLRRARSESSARPAARPSARAGSCLLPAGSQASRKASADCACTTRLCRFRTAAAACGHGGRAAAAGAQDVRVCRRIRSPFLVFRTPASWLSKRYLYPPSQQRPLPKDHAASTRAALAPFHTAISASI